MSAGESQSSEDRRIRAPYVTAEVGRQVYDVASEILGVDKAIQTSASGVAAAAMECFPADEFPTAFVVAGEGHTGRIGAQVALQLAQHDYHVMLLQTDPSASAPAPTHPRLSTIDILPTTSDFYYDFYIDALAGIDPPPYPEHYIRHLVRLMTTTLPILSIDAPTGWDPNYGPTPQDQLGETFLKPEVLVSVSLPKLCSVRFAGDFHFLSSRLLDDSMREEVVRRELVPGDEEWWKALPAMPGATAQCVVFKSNPVRTLGEAEFSPKAQPGQVYGRPGQFNATLFNDKPRRRWVDVEEEDELWDELE